MTTNLAVKTTPTVSCIRRVLRARDVPPHPGRKSEGGTGGRHARESRVCRPTIAETFTRAREEMALGGPISGCFEVDVKRILITLQERPIRSRSVASGVIDRIIGLWAAELVIVRVTEETEGPVPLDGKLSLGSDALYCSLWQANNRGLTLVVGSDRCPGRKTCWSFRVPVRA
jgi:hypothetical protein